MSSVNEPSVVELPSAGVPADQGLSSLGLMMQLAGSVFAATATMFVFFMLLMMRGTGTGEVGWAFLILGLSIARSLYHRMAGIELLYGRRLGFTDVERSRLGGVRTYIMVGLAQSAVLSLVLFGKFDLTTKMTGAIFLALAAWPLVLAALLASPRFRRFQTEMPMAEDKGFEAAAILMTVFGICGIIASGALLVTLWKYGGRIMTRGPGVLLLGALGMLVIRSGLHLQAGLSGLRETSLDRSVELANRYASFGVLSSFCVGAAMLINLMSARLDLSALVAVTVVVWLLMTWPMVVRRFFGDRQFADILAGDQAAIHRRAPDAGLTGLGWLLLGHAVFCGAQLIPMLAVGSGSGKLGDLTTLMGGPLGLRSLWFDAGLAALQAWAGFELIKMSPAHRVIGTVYAVIAAALTLYLTWPMLAHLKELRGFGGPESFVTMLTPLAIKAVLPVATLVLVNRQLAPTARARFRPRPGPGGSSAPPAEPPAT